MNKKIRIGASNYGVFKIRLIFYGKVEIELKLNKKAYALSKFRQIEPNVFEFSLGTLPVNNVVELKFNGKKGNGVSFRIVDSANLVLFRSSRYETSGERTHFITEKFSLNRSFGLKEGPRSSGKSTEPGLNFKLSKIKVELNANIEDSESINEQLTINEDSSTIQLYYGTNRNVELRSGDIVKYGTDRAQLDYGRCDVHIPKNRRTGEIPRPPWFKVWGRLNPDKYVTILNTRTMDEISFFKSMSKNAEGYQTNDVMIFVHGYNTSFEQCAMRAAQIAYDINFPGIPMFFSWSSKAKFFGYLADEDHIEYAIDDLSVFLKAIRQKGNVNKVSIVAHSMGNRGMTKALIQLLDTDFYQTKLIDQVIMAAPDIDSEYFVKKIAPKLIGCAANITLYASSLDKALIASRIIRSNIKRLGESGDKLVCMDNIETIDASAVDTAWMGHGYFSETASLINDMYGIICNGLTAQNRNLNTHLIEGKTYWSLKR